MEFAAGYYPINGESPRWDEEHRAMLEQQAWIGLMDQAVPITVAKVCVTGGKTKAGKPSSGGVTGGNGGTSY